MIKVNIVHPFKIIFLVKKIHEKYLICCLKDENYNQHNEKTLFKNATGVSACILHLFVIDVTFNTLFHCVLFS